jgi:hypothetical protein
MKKLSVVSALLIGSACFASSAMAALGIKDNSYSPVPYLSINGGAIYGNAKAKKDGNEGSFKTGKKTASTAGVALGIEGGQAVRYGVELFYNHSFGFDARDDTVEVDASYKNPMFYGVKGKLYFNVGDSEKGFAPYLIGGVGQESAKIRRKENDNKSTYTNQFWVGGVGLQGKIQNFSLFAEGTYQQSLTSKKGINSRAAFLLVGVKFHFDKF